MKSVILAFGVCLVATSSATAQCSHGNIFASKSVPAKQLALNISNPAPSSKDLNLTQMNDGWLIKYLNKPVS